MKPLPADQSADPIRLFQLLNFLMKFSPEDPSQKELQWRFAKIGIGPRAGYAFNTASLSPAMSQALKRGAPEAIAFEKQDYTTASETNAAEVTGAREFLNDEESLTPGDGLDESNPAAAYTTYWTALADSRGPRLDAPYSYPASLSVDQVMALYPAVFRSVFGPAFGYLNPNPYNPYGFDGP